MSIQIPTTKKEVAEIKKQLRATKNIICLNPATHIKFVLVAQQILLAGGNIKAAIVKAY